MRFGFVAILALAVTAKIAGAQAGDAGALRVYFADVEGGQATLFVTPAGESLLVDTGWPGFNGRDADRIVSLAKLGGVSRIDNLLITHFHRDHVGGVPQLAAKIPILRVIDHGENREFDDPNTVSAWNEYHKLLTDSPRAHLAVKPGDVLPVKGMRVEVLSADGEVIQRPLPGAGAINAACDASPTKPAENTENDRSVGVLITFGKLRILDLGDLTWAKERPLMCPVNKIGEVDLYIASHHGLERSGSPALVNAIAPRVVIMNNGAIKGGAASAWEIIEHSPRIKDLWQIHTAEHNDAAHNVAAARIANLPGPDAGNWLAVTGARDGSFTVTNHRTGEAVRYAAQ